MGTQHADPVASSVARVFDASGEVVGAGFVVGSRQVATCAHVVTAALGGNPEHPVVPAGRLRPDLPLLASSHASEAVVRTWQAIDPAALDLGAPGDIVFSGPQPLSVSTDGNILVLAVAPSTSALSPVQVQAMTLDLRPRAWQEALCHLVGGRRFSNDELATMPDGTESLTIC